MEDGGFLQSSMWDLEAEGLRSVDAFLLSQEEMAEMLFMVCVSHKIQACLEVKLAYQ